jgi:hypothetical protein
MQRSRLSRPGGLTLVEVLLLVVAALIVVGVVIPAIQFVRERDARSRSANNLKLMSLSIANLSGNFWGKVPAGYATFPSTSLGATVDTKMQSFFFWLLPFIEQSSVYRMEIADPPIQGYPVATYIAPLDPTNPGNTGANSYAVNARAFGGYTGDGTAGSPSGPRATYPGTFYLKGTSNIVTVFERYASLNGNWRGAPADNADGSCVLYGPGPPKNFGGAVKDPTFGLPPDDPNCTITANGYSGGVLQVAMADGSSRTVTSSITTPYAGTTVWGWAMSIGGPGGGLFGVAPQPAEW